LPTPAPTRTPIVAIGIGVAGLECASYGTTEQAVMNAALGDMLSANTSFGEHTCADGSSRRSIRGRRLTAAASISVDITVPKAATAMTTQDDAASGNQDTTVLGSVTHAMNKAVSSGALVSSMASYATTLGSTTMARCVRN
jgi:hypothetical protein